MCIKTVELNNPSELEKTILAVDSFARKSLGEKRYAHSVRTAETCSLICRRHNLNERIGYLCGIAHDICKELSPQKQKELALKDGKKLSELEEKKLSLLHGRAASVFLKENFGIEDKRVLEAVSYHTFGNAGMGDFAKILFTADKIEPARPQSTEEYRENLISKDINTMTRMVLEENIEYLKKHGKEAAYESYKLLEELK